MRTRPASIATLVIAIGLALTTAGITRAVPYTVGGIGSRSSSGADVWAHGTAISPAIVALVCVGLLAAIAMRPTRGGRRAAAWVAVLAGALLVAGVAEPAQQALLLLTAPDPILTPAVYAFHVGLLALILSAAGETRRTPAATELVVEPAGDAPASAVIPGVPGPAPKRTAVRPVAPHLRGSLSAA